MASSIQSSSFSGNLPLLDFGACVNLQGVLLASLEVFQIKSKKLSAVWAIQFARF